MSDAYADTKEACRILNHMAEVTRATERRVMIWTTEA